MGLVFHGPNEARRAGGAALYGRRARMRGPRSEPACPWGKGTKAGPADRQADQSLSQQRPISGLGPGHPNCASPNFAPAPALPGMPLGPPQPNSGATITLAACSQGRCNGASQPVAERSGSGLAAPCSCSRWPWLGPLHLLCVGPLRVFIFAAPASAMPARQKG